MGKRHMVVSASLFLFMCAGTVLAETDECRSGCETAESNCNAQISEYAHSYDGDSFQDSLKSCGEERSACYDRCDKEKALKEQQEKELQEQRDKERPFVAPKDM
jgi:hypothetical protein